MLAEQRIVILGCGHGGVSVAATLRQNGFEGRIALFGDETALPYHRPPLSKDCLKSDAPVQALRPQSFFDEQRIDLNLGESAAAIDRASRRITFASGKSETYDNLVLALGARARTVPIEGFDLEGVVSLRSLADAVRLKTVLHGSERICIVGGGYIGLEVAASARLLGIEVVVLERESRLLPRVASAAASAFLRRFHESRGIVFELGAAIEEMVADGGGSVGAVRLNDGRRIGCDAVLVGVGAVPNMELAETAGLECGNGVIVDIEGRTSDPLIFAGGDMTLRPLPLYGGRMQRLESVPNALEQARQIAAAICGKPSPAPETPWFWSDQFDLKLQSAGINFDAEESFVRGDPGAGKFSVAHLKGDRIQAVEAFNAPAEFMAARLMIAKGSAIDRAKLAAAAPLKECSLG